MQPVRGVFRFLAFFSLQRRSARPHSAYTLRGCWRGLSPRTSSPRRGIGQSASSTSGAGRRCPGAGTSRQWRSRNCWPKTSAPSSAPCASHSRRTRRSRQRGILPSPAAAIRCAVFGLVRWESTCSLGLSTHSLELSKKKSPPKNYGAEPKRP